MNLIANVLGQNVSSLLIYFVGLWLGVVSDFLWRRTGISKYEKRLEVFEHYHWGIALLIFIKALPRFGSASFILTGISTVFIFTETTQKHPFALRSNHGLSSTTIGAVLLILLSVIWLAA